MDAGAENLLPFPAMLTRRTPWVLVLAAVVLVGALDLHLANLPILSSRAPEQHPARP